MPERDEWDVLIDSALADYAEPRPGLEQRILARVEAEASGRTRLFGGWRLWALSSALAMASVLLVVVPWRTHRETPRTTAANTRSQESDRGPVAHSESVVPEVHSQASRLLRAARSAPSWARLQNPNRNSEDSQLPKLNVFPAPRPLSAQEEALVAIATAPSDSGRESFMAQHQADRPLEISAIQIAPITMPDEGKN